MKKEIISLILMSIFFICSIACSIWILIELGTLIIFSNPFNWFSLIGLIYSIALFLTFMYIFLTSVVSLELQK